MIENSLSRISLGRRNVDGGVVDGGGVLQWLFPLLPVAFRRVLGDAQNFLDDNVLILVAANGGFVVGAVLGTPSRLVGLLPIRSGDGFVLFTPRVFGMSPSMEHTSQPPRTLHPPRACSWSPCVLGCPQAGSPSLTSAKTSKLSGQVNPCTTHVTSPTSTRWLAAACCALTT